MGPNFSNHVLTLDYLILLCKLLISAEGLFQIEFPIFPLPFFADIFWKRIHAADIFRWRERAWAFSFIWHFDSLHQSTSTDQNLCFLQNSQPQDSSVYLQETVFFLKPTSRLICSEKYVTCVVSATFLLWYRLRFNF